MTDTEAAYGDDNPSSKSCNDVESSESLTFDPPVYVQRYQTIIKILNQEPWKTEISKVVDFGCAEFKLFKYLKSVQHIEHIFAVDLDEELMDQCRYQAEPKLFEYISRFNRKLTVDIFIGSVAEPDARLVGVDAVICIELIEHLYTDTLEKVPSTVFEYMQPKLAIFTTPNADFNVLFNLTTKFRHYDHKFEWSRQEFENWCHSIIRKYDNYEVFFEGIGTGPEGTEHLGCVSQMAVFRKIRTKESVVEVKEQYKLFKKIEYPYREDKRNEVQILQDEIKYCISSVFSNKKFYSDFETYEGFEIPIDYFWNKLKTLFTSEEELKKRLLEFGFDVGFNENGIEVVKVRDEVSDSENDDSFDFDDENVDSNPISNVVNELWD